MKALSAASSVELVGTTLARSGASGRTKNLNRIYYRLVRRRNALNRSSLVPILWFASKFTSIGENV